MKQNIFLDTLKDTEEDEAFTAYSEYINCLLKGNYWESGSTDNAKILWRSGCQARASNPGEFKCSGLYIWGGESYSVYVGKTGSTFNKRFYRYIWGQHSQCDLAEKYERELKNNGIKGFPIEVREWYKKNHPGNTSRLKGAVRFAEEGIDKIWFSLLPHANKDEIDSLEIKLIRIAERWNREHGFRSLLNKKDNTSQN